MPTTETRDRVLQKGKKRKIKFSLQEMFQRILPETMDRSKKLAIEYLGGKCSNCGYNEHYAAMHFHHVGEKDFKWVKLRLFKWERVIQELDKCILLCANCHAIEHSLES